MTERPIIMSAESVRAILDGRKTQTRRVIKDPKAPWRMTDRPYKMAWFSWYEGISEKYPDCHQFYQSQDGLIGYVRCPYGAVGDRLYVRETWKSSFSEYQETGQGHGGPDDPCWGYKATMTYSCGKPIPDYPIAWKSPIYMPKIAARIWLEITGIRAERLQEITSGDCHAEGIVPDMVDTGAAEPWGEWIEEEDYISPFINLWDNLNAKRGYSWNSNPFVWVIECQRT